MSDPERDEQQQPTLSVEARNERAKEDERKDKSNEQLKKEYEFCQKRIIHYQKEIITLNEKLRVLSSNEKSVRIDKILKKKEEEIETLALETKVLQRRIKEQEKDIRKLHEDKDFFAKAAEDINKDYSKVKKRKDGLNDEEKRKIEETLQSMTVEDKANKEKIQKLEMLVINLEAQIEELRNKNWKILETIGNESPKPKSYKINVTNVYSPTIVTDKSITFGQKNKVGLRKSFEIGTQPLPQKRDRIEKVSSTKEIISPVNEISNQPEDHNLGQNISPEVLNLLKREIDDLSRKNRALEDSNRKLQSEFDVKLQSGRKEIEELEKKLKEKDKECSMTVTKLNELKKILKHNTLLPLDLEARTNIAADMTPKKSLQMKGLVSIVNIIKHPVPSTKRDEMRNSKGTIFQDKPVKNEQIDSGQEILVSQKTQNLEGIVRQDSHVSKQQIDEDKVWQEELKGEEELLESNQVFEKQTDEGKIVQEEVKEEEQLVESSYAPEKQTGEGKDVQEEVKDEEQHVESNYAPEKQTGEGKDVQEEVKDEEQHVESNYAPEKQTGEGKDVQEELKDVEKQVESNMEQKEVVKDGKIDNKEESLNKLESKEEQLSESKDIIVKEERPRPQSKEAMKDVNEEEELKLRSDVKGNLTADNVKNFDDQDVLGLHNYMMLKEVVTYVEGDIIRAITATYLDSQGNRKEGFSVTNEGNQEKIWKSDKLILEEEETIVAISGFFLTFINKLIITTSKGRVFECGSHLENENSSEFLLDIKEDEVPVSLFGSYVVEGEVSSLTSIGAKIMKYQDWKSKVLMSKN